MSARTTIMLACLVLSACEVPEDDVEPELGIDEGLSGSIASTSVLQTMSIGDHTAGNFTVDYDVVPSGSFIHAVAGVSGPLQAAAFTDLACIVRLSPQGVFDARDGSLYRAQARVPYQAGLTYHVHFNIRMASHDYDVIVTPPGGVPVAIARRFAFRSEQATASNLRGLAVWSVSGSKESLTRIALTAGPILNGSFQMGTLPAGVSADAVAADSVTVVTAPWNSGRKALRALVRAGESWNGSGYPRSEVHVSSGLSPARRFQFHSRYRITTGLYFPPGTVFPASTCTIFQIHGDDGRSPVVALDLHDGNLQAGLLPDSSGVWQHVSWGAAPRGQLVRLEVIYQPSTASDGYVRITLGGRVVLEKTGANHTGGRLGNPTGGYWKQGIYDYWSVVESQLSVYADDVIIEEL